MSQYTGRDRFIAAVKRQYTDRVPVVMFGAYGTRLAGCTVKQAITQADKNVKSAIRLYEEFHPDMIPAVSDPHKEAEAIGCELEFPEDAPTHVKKHILEEKSRLAKLEIPDPRRDKRLPLFLEVYERLASAIKDCPVGGDMPGPWGLAADLRGLTELIYDTLDDPKFVHELMRFTTEFIKVYGVAVRETGIGLGMGEASASCSVISPQIYRDFVKPYHEDLVRYFKERKIFVMLHICGYIDPIMQDVVSTGVGMLSIDEPSSLRKLVEVSQRKLVIMGNVATSLFAWGTKEEIEQAVKECIDIAAEGSGYILASGCELPLNSTVENIRHFMEAADKYGRYSNTNI